jgi:glyoxylase-like metal-dependent hydrolase (beta-lactamase superfamily II)
MGSFIRKTFSVPPLFCNCSILADPETKQAIVIDPGGNPERILQEVASFGCTVTMVLHTHAHFDHFLASGHIKRMTNAVLCLHPDDGQLWNMLEIQCQMFGGAYIQAPLPDRWLLDEEKFVIGKVHGEVIHTPGHSPGSLSFYFESVNMVFSGDTLFRGGIGRTDLWGGDARAIEHSIRERLYSFKEDTLVIPGHGPETQIGFERQYNAFFPS